MQSVTFPKSPRFAFFQSSVMRNTLYIQLCAWYILAFMLGRYIIHNIVLNAKLAQQIHCDRTLGLCSQAFKKQWSLSCSLVFYTSVLSVVTLISMFCCYSWHTIQQSVICMFWLRTDCECCFQFAVVILR